MDTKLYNRIVDHAQEIILNGNLPWEGLYTARSVYKALKNSSKPLSPEEIAEPLGISPEYVNQVILALQNGGVRITSSPGDKSWTGRPKSKYSVN